MTPYKSKIFNGHGLIKGRVWLVMAASSLSLTLIACSQPDATAANSAQAEPTTEAQTLAVKAVETPTTPMIPSQSLKNVSATVYKDANCGCCKEWISHAEGHGLSATGNDVADLSIFKERYGVPDNMRSCHTTVTTDGYVFEGHVPAKLMAQFLASPPAGAIGLAVPGMPMGSPGMEYQNKFDPYQVMQMNKDGSTVVYADIKTPQQQL